mgnify:FL=1
MVEAEGYEEHIEIISYTVEDLLKPQNLDFKLNPIED